MAAITGVLGVIALLVGLLSISITGDIRMEVRRVALGQNRYAEDDSKYDKSNPLKSQPFQGTCRTGGEYGCDDDAPEQVFNRANRYRHSASVAASLGDWGCVSGVFLMMSGAMALASAGGKAGSVGALFWASLAVNSYTFALACEYVNLHKIGPSIEQAKTFSELGSKDKYYYVPDIYAGGSCYNTEFPPELTDKKNENCSAGSMAAASVAFIMLAFFVNLVIVVIVTLNGEEETQKSQPSNVQMN